MHRIDYQYLRPKKAAALKKWHETPFPERTDLTVWQGKNATILPLQKQTNNSTLFGAGGVVDLYGNYVPLSGIEYRIWGGYAFENPQYVDKKVVFCGYLINHWGHFLVEAVARLWYLFENDSSIDKYVFIVENNSEREIKGNYREFLTLLNVWDKIELVRTPTTYREVVVPELAFLIRKYYSPQYISIFDAVASNITVNADWNTHPKVYFSRSQLPQNQWYEFGFEALDDFFQKNGYAILHPERISLSEFIYLIRHAEVVASVSGSLPHNMLFACNGQSLQIVERCVVNNDYQVYINTMRHLQTVYIDANIPVYSVSAAGPFILGYNDNMEHFAIDHGYCPPSAKYTSPAYLRSCFTKYMRTYDDMYQLQWFMDSQYPDFADYLYEAYQAGFSYFGDYLTRKKPFLRRHYFEFHYWKQFIKRILRYQS